MDESNISTGDQFYEAILIFTIIFLILFLFYLSLVIVYIIKNYHKKKLCVFWIDYCVLLLGALFFIFVYLAFLIFRYEKYENRQDKHKYPSLAKLKNKFYPPAIVMSLSFLCYTLIATLLFDGITAIRLSIKMIKMKAINDMDLNVLSEKLNSIDYVDILKMKLHHIYNFVFYIINLFLIGLEIYAYIDLNPNNYGTPWNLQGFFDYLLRFYHLIVMAFLIISICIMNYNKKLLLRKKYYNPNRIAQKVYDAHFGQIFYFTDVLSFKLVADLIMNIPPSFFMSSGKFGTWSLIFSEIAIFVYIFLGGGQYLVIDRHSRAGKVNKLIKIFFCLKGIDFHFGEKDVRSIKDEFAYDYTKEEKSILENLNIKIIQNVESELLKDESENSFSSSNIELHTTKN